jgi:predicted nicotinamide N-methyase
MLRQESFSILVAGDLSFESTTASLQMNCNSKCTHRVDKTDSDLS